MKLVLASASPRRQELLADLGLSFTVRPADIDESVHAGEAGTDYVRRLAREKAAAVAGSGELVLAADTTVDLNGELLGKPVDEDDARALMRKLSDSVHYVHTGVCALLIDADGSRREESTVVTTAVTFAPVPDAWIDYDKTKIGFEIPFTRQFYKYVPPRPLEAIEEDIRTLEEEIVQLLRGAAA